MTKKIFAMFLAVLMVVSMLPTSVFAAGSNCPGKGEHTLENCSYTVVKVTDPTCGAMGFTTYKCDVCGETFSESWLPATGEHQWTALEALAPTCAKPGYEAGRQCSVCGKKEYGAKIPQLDKDATECEWVDLTPTINCETGGMKKFECAFCGATWEFEVKPGQHTWDEANPKLVKPATLTENGLAEVTCTTCRAVKEVEVLFAHKHDHNDPAGYIEVYPEVPATCTTTGMKSYMQCRICGAVNYQRDFGSYKTWGWFQLTEAEWASLVIPAAHKFDHEPTCVDTVLTCTICKQNVPVNVAHVVDWDNYNWNGQGEYRPATCSTSGYMASWCQVCEKFRDVKILPALGHYEVTVNVPATCLSNAYSYTYCTRAGCVEGKQNPEALYPMQADKYLPATAPVVGEGFYLTTFQENADTALFFTGKMEGNYLATSFDVSKAAVVYLEIVHPLATNAYRMYFYNAEGVKTYIEIYEYDTQNHKVGVHLTANPVNVFNWDATNGVLTTTLNNTAYYLNTYNNFQTISASKISYIATSFPAYLGEIGVKADVNVIKYNIVKDSVNASAHHMVSEIIVQPTCTEPGMKQVRCSLCGGAADIVEIPAAHRFEPMVGTLTVEGKSVAASKAVSCEDGWQYFQCTLCQEIKKVTYPGYGHVLGQLVEETPNHMVPVVYDHQDCIYCDYSLKLTKKTWNDANKHWDTFEAANKAHDGALTGSGIVVKAGDCTEYGLKMYTCGDCQKAVYVKIEGTGKHVIPDGTKYTAPTCTDKGYIATYECARCKAIVGNAKLGALNEIPALGHNWVENENYKAADCAAPNYANFTHFCSVCKIGKGDGTKLLHVKLFDDDNPCEATAFEYYLCHCGKEHMISFIVELGHNMVEMPRYDADGKVISANFKAPTCYATGFTTYYCTFCGETQVKTLAMVEHVNKDGVKFTDKCTDTVEDRHCVVCHKANGHDALGNSHDCYTADTNKDGVLDCLGKCLIGKSCHYVVNTNMPSTCLQDAYTLKVCGDCGDQIVVPNTEFEWNGHKPASNVETYYEDKDGNVVPYAKGPQPTYLAGYTYDKDYVWYSVEVNEDGEFEQHTEAYTAKYIEYIPATYTSNGYAKMYCQECKQIVEQIIPKKDGLNIELNASNANGANEFTHGSLVEVVVTANGLEESVYGYDFELNFSEGLVFVGYETLNENFIFTVANPENVKDSVKIAAFASNDVNGKMQNIEITPDTALVKLFFRVKSVNAGSQNFTFENAQATAVKNNETSAVACVFEPKSIDTRAFLDFNKDGVFSVNDLYLAMSLLTGEHPAGKTYDVTMDVNKDGEVTLEELSIAYNHHVGNYTQNELFIMGMSDAEIALMHLNEKTVCNNSACQKEIDANATYCPYCGNHQ